MDKILDIGSGQNPKPDATHLIDIVPIQIGGKTFIKHDLNETPYPFKSNYFDKIYSDNVFEHLGIRLYDFLLECNRLLKQDGILILEMPNAWFIKKRIWFLFGMSLPSYSPQHLQYPRPSLVKSVMIHMGFDVKGNSSDLFAHMIKFKGRKRGGTELPKRRRLQDMIERLCEG